jgi:hypothetical protein
LLKASKCFSALEKTVRKANVMSSTLVLLAVIKKSLIVSQTRVKYNPNTTPANVPIATNSKICRQTKYQLIILPYAATL